MRTRRHPWKPACLLLAGLALVTVACGGEDEGTADAGWIVGLLARIPDTEVSGHEVALVDLAAAAAAAGVAVPSPGAAPDEVTDYLLSLPRDTLVPELLQRTAADVDALRAELGFDHAAIEAAVSAGEPPEQFLVLKGAFDDGAVEAAVHSDPVWSDLLTSLEHAGVAYYAWGADMEIDVERVTPARPLGRGGRLALDDGYVYWVPWTAGLESLIDAGAGTVPTLAERPLMARVAAILQREQVYSAILTDTPLLEGRDVSGLVLGVGGGRDEAGAFWVVVAIHDTAAAAEESAAAFRSVITEGSSLATNQPWSERVASFEVTVEGEAMVAVVHSAGGEGDWMRAYYLRDSPLLAAQG
jgi:hypothetical protein